MVQMKKGLVLICALLALLIAVPALAQSTGLQVDGKTYIIMGGDGVYAMEGITFIIDGDEVTVIREGMEDLHLQLEAAEETDVVEAAPGCGSVMTFTVNEEIATVRNADHSAAYCVEEGEAVTGGIFSIVISDGLPGVEAVSEDSVSVYAFDAFADGAAERSNAIGSVYVTGSKAMDEEYEIYAAYGLRYDVAQNVLYYRDQRVRVFEDDWKLYEDAFATLRYFDDEGVVDVRALRDEEDELAGLEALSEAEFAARDLSAWLEPNVTRMEMTATDGRELTPEELEAFFEPYAAFGLRYDAERDLLFYGDRQVRKLVDVRVSNGEALGSGEFSGELTQLVYEGGEVDVTAIRDYENPGEDGCGRLIGLNVEEVK